MDGQSAARPDAGSQEGANERSRIAAARLADATRRDETAAIRDLTAAIRDRVAAKRDAAAGLREVPTDAGLFDATAAGRAGQALRIAELVALAAFDRRESAADRTRAAADRAAAAKDRRRAAAALREAGLDDLTGVLRRATGELALMREIHRSRRLRRSLVLAMIDVNGLKRANDAHGHTAGDVLLRAVPDAITATFRAYDVVVRWGGDEFVCALSDTSLDVARERIHDIERALHSRPPGCLVHHRPGPAHRRGDPRVPRLTRRRRPLPRQGAPQHHAGDVGPPRASAAGPSRAA